VSTQARPDICGTKLNKVKKSELMLVRYEKVTRRDETVTDMFIRDQPIFGNAHEVVGKFRFSDIR
jgi:hypothetical protein